SWRICTDEFRLSSGICGSCGIGSPPTGHECCPEVPRATARVLAEDPEMVRPQSVAPRVVRAPVWICGIRTSGLRRSVAQRGPYQELWIHWRILKPRDEERRPEARRGYED
ncbi:hypothetical protein TcG_12084, partial [Trypanosoma cruzi]